MFGVLGLAGLFGKLIDFLKSPIGIILVVVGVYFLGHWRGEKEARVECAQEKAASREAARRIDERATGESRVAMADQLRAAEARAAAGEKAVAEYAKRLKESPDCAIDPATADELNRVRDQPLPGR